MAVGFIAWSLACAAAPPPPPTGPLPEWPCKQPDTTLSAASLAPSLASAEGNAKLWPADGHLRSLAAYAAAPENTPRMGLQKIGAFAREAGGLPPRDKALLLAGVVDGINQLRTMTREGVAHMVVNSRLVSENLATVDQALSAAAAADRADLETQRARLRSQLGDLADDAGLLCHRLDYTGQKAQMLADGIRDLSE